MVRCEEAEYKTWGSHSSVSDVYVVSDGIARAEPDGTRAETRIRLSPKRTSPFKSVGASVQSTALTRRVRISSSNGSNAGQTTFRGKVELYWLLTPFACFPFTSPPVRHPVQPGSERALNRYRSFSGPKCLHLRSQKANKAKHSRRFESSSAPLQTSNSHG